MFAERRPLFLDRFENLKKALDCAYLRSLENADSLESMIFFTITAGPCTQDNMNLSSTIKSIQDIMCKDDGVDGNAQLRARDAAHCVAWRSGSSRVSQPEGRSSMPLTALILGPGIKAVKWRADRFHVIPLRTHAWCSERRRRGESARAIAVRQFRDEIRVSDGRPGLEAGAQTVANMVLEGRVADRSAKEWRERRRRCSGGGASHLGA